MVCFGSDADIVLEGGAKWTISALLSVPVEVRWAANAWVVAVSRIEGSA